MSLLKYLSVCTVFVSLLAIVVSPFSVFAAEGADVGLDAPAWFPILEIVGAGIAILTVINMAQAAGAAAGGSLSVVFMRFVWGAIFFAIALIWRSFLEITGQESGEQFVAVLIFEIPLYLGLVFLALGGHKAKRILTTLK